MKQVFILTLLLLISPSVLAYWSCAWPYRTEIRLQENSGTTLTDYQVEIDITGANLNAAYNWTTNGFDLRFIDSDDSTSLDFWIESWDSIAQTATIWVRLPTFIANELKTIYVYYGNNFATQLDNVPFTFVEPGIKFHTRRATTNPNSLTEAFNIFNAGNDSTAGYGCTFITNFTGITNSGTFGSGNNFIAYSETFFNVTNSQQGDWGIRYGSDFGWGGGLYVDGQVLEEDWLTDLWWSSNWNHPDVLQGTINLTSGYHRLEIIGGEGCCDGGLTVQFQPPGGSWTTYSTSNIDIVSRACPGDEPTVTFGVHETATCPTPIAQYRLEKTVWSIPGDVLDSTGSFNGSMLGTVNSVTNAQVCRGAQVASNFSNNTIDAIQTGVDVDADIGNAGSIAFWIRTENNWNDGFGRTLFDASLDNTEGGSDKYFFLEKLTDGRLRLRFEDSADGDYNVIENSVPSRASGTWYHVTVTWDMPNNAYQIFVGDTLVGSATINTNDVLADLTLLYFGDNASSLYTIAPGNSADATFDEISIYNSVLSVSEIRGLMSKSRSCATSLQYCDATFPDGIGSTSGSQLNFGFNAALLNNPDTQLSAAGIVKNGGSTLLTCETADCSTGDSAVNDVSPGSFQFTFVTNDVDISNGSSATLTSSTDEFDLIRVRSNATLTVDPNYVEYFIDDLRINSSATLNLSSGTYWVNDLRLGSSATINITSTPVRLYINDVVNWSSNVTINSPSYGVAGSSENLLTYIYSNASFGSSLTYTGALYINGDLSVSSGGRFFGLLTAHDITFNSNNIVQYDDTAYAGMADITWCEAGSLFLSAINITAPATGINCLASNIQIDLVDSNGDKFTGFSGDITLSSSTNNGNWGKIDALGNLVTSGSDDGYGQYGMLTTDQGDIILSYRNTHPETTELRVEAQGILSRHTIAFERAGFAFSSIPSQIAAKDSSNISIQAVETDLVTGSCQALLVNNNDIQLAVECENPTACGASQATITPSGGSATNVNVNNSGSVSSYSDVSLDFGDASDSDAEFVLNYNEAGQIQIHAQYELVDDNGNPTGEIITGTSNSFVSLPDGFCVQSTDANSDCTTNPLSDCSVFTSAGTDFNLNVIAKRYQLDSDTDFCDNSTVSNFNGSVDLTLQKMAPTDGSLGTLNSSTANLTNGSSSGFTNSISEVGVFRIFAGGNTYLGESLPSTGSENVGRFTPNSFSFISHSNGALSSGCGNYVYIGQRTAFDLDGDLALDGAITYQTAPSLTFEARNANDVVLQNYRDDFIKNPQPNVQVSTSVLDNSGGNMAIVSSINPATVAFDDTTFQLESTLNTNDNFYFQRNSLAEINAFSINTPTDNVLFNVVDITDDDSVTTSTINQAIRPGQGGVTVNVRFGRMVLANNSGPANSSLPVNLQVEYLNNGSYIVSAEDTNCSGFETPALVAGSYTGDLVAGDTQILAGWDTNSDGIGEITNGLSVLTLQAPVDEHAGSVDVTLDLSNFNWLQYDWDSDGSLDNNPQAKASFGVYRGNDRVIYWKELYR